MEQPNEEVDELEGAAVGSELYAETTERSLSSFDQEEEEGEEDMDPALLQPPTQGTPH